MGPREIQRLPEQPAGTDPAGHDPRDSSPRLEAQAERARQHLAAIVESSDDAIISEDLDGVLTSWNAGAERLYGYHAEEVLGKSRSVLIPPERAGEFDSMLERLRHGEHIDHFETVRRRKDGRRITVSVSMSPLRGAAGQIVGAAGIGRDITARNRADEALHLLVEASSILAGSLDYQDTFQSLARLVVPRLADWCTVSVLDEDGAIRRVALAVDNPAREPAVRELYEHYPADPSRPYGLARVLRGGSSELYPDISESVLSEIAHGDAHHARLLREAGFSSVMIVPLVARGRTLGAISFVSGAPGRHYDQDDLALAEDLGRRAAVAVDNARLYEQARAAVRLRDEFLSVAAHELRTPLTTLSVHAQIMLRQIERESLDLDRLARSLQSVEQQTQRLTRLITHLLDISQIEAGHLSLESQPFDLVVLVKSTAAAAESATDQHPISVVGPPELRIEADPLRLEQVLANLLDNAVKYSPRGGPVEITLDQPDSASIVLAVRDHGLGIAPENRARIFERFYRAHGSTHASGIGLGLYITRQIVELHSGQIEAEFSPDGGTRFVVRLPASPAHSRPAPASRPP